jgi:hypothetical protein
MTDPVIHLPTNLRVRCTRSPLLFCVKDFLIAISKDPLDSDDANLYWITMQLRLLEEPELQSGRAVRFQDQVHVVCISATGLMIVMHHFGTMRDVVETAGEIQSLLETNVLDIRDEPWCCIGGPSEPSCTDSFTLKSLVAAEESGLTESQVNTVCRAVASRMKRVRPSSLFYRRNTVCFPRESLSAVENVLQEEVARLRLRTVGSRLVA